MGMGKIPFLRTSLISLTFDPGSEALGLLLRDSNSMVSRLVSRLASDLYFWW